ncbi:hypothetical protein Gogos_004753 [Gossypium gossypioides]|uniref:DUF4283 domain-containing protein n=1 Tax=Gossypium gossypioides TaxID=34282 RepID=A0A7J9CHF3_GOSGO|nr:hypothetical protein [Gossypium gossypioides]
MEDELENLSLVDDEEEAIQEETAAVESISQFCLVGHCLTDSVVHFPSLRNTMEISSILLEGFVDIARVLARTPWFFNNHLLILQRISYGENPVVLELNFIEFWIQVYELPPGLMSESMAK